MYTYEIIYKKKKINLLVLVYYHRVCRSEFSNLPSAMMSTIEKPRFYVNVLSKPDGKCRQKQNKQYYRSQFMIQKNKNTR